MKKITPYERLRIQRSTPGAVIWRVPGDNQEQRVELTARGSAMSEGHSYSTLLPLLETAPPFVEFRFDDGEAEPVWHRVAVAEG